MCGETQGDTSTLATTKSLAKDQHISELLTSMENDLLPGVLSTNEGAPLGYDYSPSCIQHGSNKKVLRISDFVTANLDACDEDETDELIKWRRLLIRKDTEPKVTEVTLPEWISVNVRILTKLINQKEIVSLDEVKWYMEYTTKIGDHAWENTIPSVMCFDNKYRKEQASKSWLWEHDDPFLMHKKPSEAPDCVEAENSNEMEQNSC